MRKYGFRDWDSVLAAIGHGGLKEGQVFNKLMEAYDKENQKNLTDEQVLEATGEAQEKLHVTKNKGGIVVKGIHDVAVRFSKCCSPIPGDEIVGFVTRTGNYHSSYRLCECAEYVGNGSIPSDRS